MSKRPEDILPDNENTKSIDGMLVRKGTIAAFLHNIEIFESLESSEQQKAEALNTMQEFAPALVTLGLRKHVVFKNKFIQSMLDQAP